MSIKVMKLLQQMNHSSKVLNVGHLHVVCFLPPAIKKPGLTKKANDPMALRSNSAVLPGDVNTREIPTLHQSSPCKSFVYTMTAIIK